MYTHTHVHAVCVCENGCGGGRCPGREQGPALSVLRALFSVPGTHTRPFIDNQLRSVTRVVAAGPKRPLAHFSTPVYHVAYPHQRGVAARQLSTQWEANHILCRFSAHHPHRNTHTHTHTIHPPHDVRVAWLATRTLWDRTVETPRTGATSQSP